MDQSMENGSEQNQLDVGASAANPECVVLQTMHQLDIVLVHPRSSFLLTLLA